MLVSAVALAACATSPVAADVASAHQPTSTRTTVPTATSSSTAGPTAGSPASLARTDAQGSVEFVVEPLNLSDGGDTLAFTVSMNTHSVDVGWDLAALATLETDAGAKVSATAWPIGSGHHYGGTLSFPRLTADGENLLAGAGILRLVIRDTDVPERVFTWELAP
jgi:uncharacterized protein YjdB